jgi:hypothetical protein
MERIMNAHVFQFRGETFHALPSGALYWPSERLLVVSDLHMGKSERAARRGGPMLPPYEGIDTLLRLSGDIAATAPKPSSASATVSTTPRRRMRSTRSRRRILRR